MNKWLFVIPVILVVCVGVLQVGYSGYVKSRPMPETVTYTGSKSCKACHHAEHYQWQGSLHAKMMRPLDEETNVAADLSLESGIPFDPADIVWTIGGKWEQQFMGSEFVDGEEGGQKTRETLLPGAWLIEKREWMLQGWDGWQQPVPLERCHGCHTVGLDIETGRFVEASIGCESCHGPGSWHVETKGLGKIHNSVDGQMCGQCHTRGKALDGKHFFPVDYKPWEDLEAIFNESKPDPLQNSSHWWANGHARKRHQEYYSWKQGGHSNSLKSLKENYDGRFGKVTESCLTCHAGEAAIIGAGHGLKLSEVEQGITCTTCHQVHGELDKLRVTCQQCRSDGAYYHEREWHEREGQVKGLAVDHIPCPASANVQCVDCHMPKTGWNGGDYTLHSHTAGIIPPLDTAKWGVPNSCANGGCHSDTEQGRLEQMFNDFYGNIGTSEPAN